MAYDKEVQTEAQSPEGIRATKKHNRKIQVNLPLITTMWDSDPRMVTLREGLTQAQQAAEKLIEQTVPRERYEELQ